MMPSKIGVAKQLLISERINCLISDISFEVALERAADKEKNGRQQALVCPVWICLCLP
jgi:hypothetical protein